jgi:hypothetical protein
VRLTDEQAQEMERLLLLRILGDATEEYSFALAELEQRDEFRRYMMRRAESSGFTVAEIADATEQSWGDVEASLHDDGDAPVEDSAADAHQLESAAAAELSALDEEAPQHDDGGSEEAFLDGGGGSETSLHEEGQSQREDSAADARELDDLTDTIKHLSMQIGSDDREHIGTDDGRGNEAAAMAVPETPDVPAITSWPWNRS